MRGGKFVRITHGCALGVMMLALQFAVSPLMTVVLAHPGHEDEDCHQETEREQSIVISAKQLSSDGSAAEAVEASAESALEPIANVSEYEPELADPPAPEPTVAETDVEAPLARVASRPQRESASDAEEKTEQAEPISTEPEAISFNGIVPGLSRRIDVLRGWGDPRSDDTQAVMLKYRFDDLPSVEVHFDGSLVASIVVELARPMTGQELRSRLKIEPLQSAAQFDDKGTAIAEVFPERGVVFRFVEDELGLEIVSDDAADQTAADPLVGSIVIQPIQAKPFLQRAEQLGTVNLTQTIADLEQAVQIDHSLGDARVALSSLQLKVGKAATAERYAAEAVELEPNNAAYRLQWAKCLRHLARYDRAVEEVRKVLESANIDPLVRAQALNEMGLLASLGSKQVAKTALPLHSKAIELADSLAVGEDGETARQAKQLLVEAHLAVAVEIAHGDWKQKDESVPQWIERASALAEAMIAKDSSNLPLRLQVAVNALAAAASMDEPIDPTLWLEEAEETAFLVKRKLEDPVALEQVEWQLGLVYFHASQIEHRRSQPEKAIEHGEQADRLLTRLAKRREEMPDTAYLLGRVYFQVGAAQAVHFEDHLAACQWYDRAVERLINPVPVTTLASPQEHGDALVSMGVSYWHQSEHRRAVEVTAAGVELLEDAVAGGLLESEALEVSYNNLSAMHRALGDNEPAARYQRLAKQITGTKLSQKAQPASQAKRR